MSPITKKLGIKPGYKVLILNAPEGYIHSLEPLPEGAEVARAANGKYDFVQLFVYNKADVDKNGLAAWENLKPGGTLWYAYPKKTGQIKTDITRDVAWEKIVEAGFGPVAMVSLDDTWSAFRFRPNSEVKSRQ
jgi:hypothetical protein